MLDYAAARKHMVDSQVRPNDVTDLRLQRALEMVPREAFVPESGKAVAYAEQEISLSAGRRLLTARDFAKLAAAAEIGPEDYVLDWACASGYAAAVLSQVAHVVTAVDSDGATVGKAKATLAALGVDNVETTAADVSQGPAGGPFNVIIIASGAVERLPEGLLDRLAEGGRLVAILRDGGVSRGRLYTRCNGAASSRTMFDAATSFVLPEFAAPKIFAF